MLQLSNHQLLAIERGLLAERAAEILRVSFPDTAGALDVDALVQQAQQQIVRAQSYGLLQGSHVFRFILSAWIFGPGFDERVATVRAMLQDASLSSAERAGRLERAVLDTLAALSHDTSSNPNEVGR